MGQIRLNLILGLSWSVESEAGNLACSRVAFNAIPWGLQGATGQGDGFEVTKYGHARVALIGFPR